MAKVRVQTGHDELNKVLAVAEPALEEPHDQDVMGHGDDVGVELEGIGERKGDGEHGHVVRVGEAGEYVREPDQGGEELEHGAGDHLGGGDLGEVEEDLRDDVVHAALHLEGAGGERADADLVALLGEEASVEGVDELPLDGRLEVLVEGGHGRQHGEHAVVELGAGQRGRLVLEALGQLALPRREVNQGQCEGLDRIPVPRTN